MRESSLGVIWTYSNVLLLVYLTTFLILFFPLCLGVLGHTDEFLKKQVFIA